MSRATRQIRKFAERLIAYENRKNRFSEKNPRADFHICEKLRSPLASLAGNGGFRALLSRSIALASEEVLWLHAVHVRADGSLEGLEEVKAKVDPSEVAKGEVVLVAELLGLLIAFIGKGLTFSLVRGVWPKVPLNDLDFSNGDENEKTE